MNKEYLQKLIDNNLSQRQIGIVLSTSQTNVRYWLNKFNIKTKNKRYLGNLDVCKEKHCFNCSLFLPLKDFYSTSSSEGHERYKNTCKNCENAKTIQKSKDVKITMLEYKGNECAHCKLNVKDSHPSVFEFHHTDPKTKHPNFIKIKSWKWEKIVKELDKCLLLCANCHRIEHYKE